MLHKTRGIILHSVSYNDTYSFVHIFTEEFGRVSYLTAKSKGKQTKVNKSLFYPLSVLDLEVEHFNLRDVHRIKEAKPHWLSTNILFDPVKSAICIFLSEFISKVIKDIQPNPLLFNYICDSIRLLDLLERSVANFHLVFIFRLSRFLGFYPDMTEYKKGMFFDLQNGEFVNYKPFHPYFLNPDDSEIFALLMRMDYSNMHGFKFSHTDRVNIINKVLEYYRLHLSDFPELKSLEVLQSLFI